MPTRAAATTRKNICNSLKTPNRLSNRTALGCLNGTPKIESVESKQLLHRANGSWTTAAGRLPKCVRRPVSRTQQAPALIDEVGGEAQRHPPCRKRARQFSIPTLPILRKHERRMCRLGTQSCHWC